MNNTSASALIWELGEALAIHGSELFSVGENTPSNWSAKNTQEIVNAIKQAQPDDLLVETLPVVERLMFPRLALYMYGRSKLICNSTNDGNLPISLQNWASINDVTQITPETVEDDLRNCFMNQTEFAYSEVEHLNILYRLDVIFIATRVLVALEPTLDNYPKNTHSQALIQLLQALLDFGHLDTMHPVILGAFLTLSRHGELHRSEPVRSDATGAASLPCSFVRGLRPSIFDLPDALQIVPSSLPILLGEESDYSLSVGPNDILIVVTGPSGAGKSSFINRLFGREVATAHNTLASCTEKVRAFACMHPHRKNQKIVIVDTPGFDDTSRTDYQVLEEIAKWLEATYKRKILLSALLQFHNISEVRMRSAPRRNLTMFQTLCGKDAYKNVVLLTTFWDQIMEQTGATREKQLEDEFWKPLIDHGSRVNRFYPPTFERAWEIINQFSPIDGRAALTVQTEMVDEKKKLHETSVFQAMLDFWTKMVNTLTGKSRKKIAKRSREQKQTFEKHKLSPKSPNSATSFKKIWFS